MGIRRTAIMGRPLVPMVIRPTIIEGTRGQLMGIRLTAAKAIRTVGMVIRPTIIEGTRGQLMGILPIIILPDRVAKGTGIKHSVGRIR